MRGKNGAVPLTAEGISLAIARANSPEVRREYLASLKQEVKYFEREYSLPSVELRAALQSKRIKESLGVVKWLYAIEALSRLENARETRVEQSRKLPARPAAGVKRSPVRR